MRTGLSHLRRAVWTRVARATRAFPSPDAQILVERSATDPAGPGMLADPPHRGQVERHARQANPVSSAGEQTNANDAQQPRVLVRDRIARLRRSIRRHGSRIVISSLSAKTVDYLLNIDSEDYIELDTTHAGKLQTTESIDHSFPYEPTPFLGFRKMMRSLQIAHSEFVFVDMGCGLGRVLINAATYPFAKVIGVEFSTPMAEAALRNASHARLIRRRSTIDVACQDARAFNFTPGNYVVYLFNPFDATTIRDIVAKMERALEQHDVKIFVIYYNCKYAHVFHRTESFTQTQAGTVRNWTGARNHNYLIFESTQRTWVATGHGARRTDEAARHEH
ncbi:hypothetical protein BH23ACT10_BH23ACT10_25470 [soil metagenome]